MEYENSASTIDIRFVPSDTEFNDKPCAIATDNSVASDFVPSKQVLIPFVALTGFNFFN